MLTSISPLGERARASRWWVTTTAYVVVLVVGGLALGLVAAALGGLLPAVVALVAGPLLARRGRCCWPGCCSTRAWPAGGCPTWRRQVDEAWLGRYRGWVVGVGFGAQLGFGVVTIVTSATTYAVVLLCAAVREPAVGLLVGRHVRAGAGAARRRSWAGVAHRTSSCAGCSPGWSAGRRAPTRLGWRWPQQRPLTVIAVRALVDGPARHLRRGAGGVVDGHGAPSRSGSRRPDRPRLGARGSTAATPRDRSPSAPCRCVHVCTRPMPAERGDFGSGAVEVLGPEDVFVALVEYGSDLADAGPVRAAGRAAPRAVAVRHRTGCRATIVGRSASQHFFSDGRPGVLPVHRAGQPLPPDGAPCRGRAAVGRRAPPSPTGRRCSRGRTAAIERRSPRSSSDPPGRCAARRPALPAPGPRVAARVLLVGAAVAGSALATDPKAYALTPQTGVRDDLRAGQHGLQRLDHLLRHGQQGRQRLPAGQLHRGLVEGGRLLVVRRGLPLHRRLQRQVHACSTGCADHICDRTCWNCSCGSGSTGHLRPARHCCNAFRYGQCNTQVRCSGGVHCRVVSLRGAVQVGQLLDDRAGGQRDRGAERALPAGLRGDPHPVRRAGRQRLVPRRLARARAVGRGRSRPLRRLPRRVDLLDPDHGCTGDLRRGALHLAPRRRPARAARLPDQRALGLGRPEAVEPGLPARGRLRQPRDHHQRRVRRDLGQVGRAAPGARTARLPGARRPAGPGPPRPGADVHRRTAVGPCRAGRPTR